MSDHDRGDSGFLARWSRRKREVDQEAATDRDKDAAISPAPAATDELSEAERQRIVEQLPDIDSLEADSDFTAFLREGVPTELRDRALRKLWRLDPVFANLDGLNDYDLDYTNAATVVENLKSAWRAGKGYARDDDAAPSAAEVSPGETAPPAAGEGVAPETPLEDGGEDASGRSADAATAVEAHAEADAASTSTAPQREHGAAPADEASSPTSRPRRPAGSAARRRWG